MNDSDLALKAHSRSSVTEKERTEASLKRLKFYYE